MTSIHTRRLKLSTWSMLIGCVVSAVFVLALEKPDKSVVNVVVVGGTGDLAKKYLWQGFFNLYQGEKDEYLFNFYGAARIPVLEGDDQIANIMRYNVSCGKSVRPGQGCEEALEGYRNMVAYRKLKTVEDYAKICQEMVQTGKQEHGRLFYLSVPPFAYAGITENIAKACRPDGNTWLRVVLEKPFGHDLNSAQELAAKLSLYLREDEIYRIDHYLGKIGVQSILPFRALNAAKYEGLWNRDHIQRVEIAMKETIDASGRLAFYDEYGVIRDVMQNHLTEIFALVAMEIPKNIQSHREFLNNKIRLLNQTRPVKPNQAVIGQYDGYIDQWHQELDKHKNEESLVPTFAAATFYVDSPRWKDVPFVLVAGKKLDERVGYVRMLFKDDAVCISSTDVNGLANRCSKNQQVVFYTSNPGLKYPTILVSNHLPKPTFPLRQSVNSDPNAVIFGSNLSDFYHTTTPVDLDAYTSLISSCFHGDQKMFVGTSDLMASWKIWSSLLRSFEDKRPRIYAGGLNTGNWLDVKVKGHALMFIHGQDDASEIQDTGASTFASLSGNFRNRPLITGNQESVIAQLRQHLLAVATQAISKRGSFHLALPGGTTPRPLFDHLATKLATQFPWQDTVVWMLDERCVPFTDDQSNFNQLHDLLLQHVHIPYFNIKPMPVKLGNGLCHPSDKGSKMYEDDMNQIPDGKLDYILLGMGQDGHVASLFPNHQAVEEKTARVVITDGRPNDTISHRMTLTFPMINSARHAGILILGRAKRDIVSVLKTEEVTDAHKYPVMGVNLNEGQQVWYIDHEAIL